MMIFITSSIAFQTSEVDFGGSFRNQSCLTLYFALTIDKKRLSFLDAIIQASLAKRALFTSLAF